MSYSSKPAFSELPRDRDRPPSPQRDAKQLHLVQSLSTLPYRTLQKKCKEFGLKAHGKKNDLIDSIIGYIRGGSKETSDGGSKNKFLKIGLIVLGLAVAGKVQKNSRTDRITR